MTLVIILILLVFGSVIFHLVTPWWMTPVASNWASIDDTINLTFWITGFVFVAINLFLAYAIYRYRYKADRKAHYEPENKKLEIWLTVFTAVGVAAMLAPGLIVWNDFVTVPEGADEIEVVGEQWQWSFRLPGEDGQLGRVDARFIGPENRFGMSPEDPAGLDDVLILTNELHLPLHRAVKVNLRSKDVLHDFSVAQFRVKMDLVPGTVTYLWFEPTRVGKFDILCMELCGIGHYTMRGYVVIEPQEDYDLWLAQQKTWATIKGEPPGDAQQGQAQFAICASCHGQQGEGIAAMNAPRLAGLQPWYVERQLRYYQQGIRGKHEDDMYGQQMAPMAGVLANDTAIRDVAAYIETLEGVNGDESISGNIKKGARSFVNCGACHGTTGEGNYALGAPRLAGQSDWYIKRQLQNFRTGIRGAHKSDTYGHQMALMARTLQDEEAIDDLLAYLNSL